MITYRFRSKPVEIDAFQLGVMPPPPWFLEALHAGAVTRNEHGFDALTKDGVIPAKGFLIHTREGKMQAKPLDYICRDNEGGLYPCTQTIFEHKYEAI